jgi:hypothetical protein
MVTPEYLDKHYYDKIFTLDKESIIRLNESRMDGSLNNVVVGLHSHCYGLDLINDEGTVDYHVYYINGENELVGDLLKLNLHDKERDRLLLIFSNYLADTYGLDILETFNSFQEATRSMCERIDYLTITANELQEYKGYKPTFIAKGVKGIIVVPFLYHLDLYKFLFGALKYINYEDGQNYIYLMFNKRNKLVKIGKSRNPGHREKTLQAEEPEITLVAVWKGADKVERELHKLYKKKRLRGEWFNLSFKELKGIKQFMESVAQNVSGR